MRRLALLGPCTARWRRALVTTAARGSGGIVRRTESTTPLASASQKRLSVELDGNFVSFDQLFLRDACPCPRCVHPATQQKLFRTTDIPYDVRADRIDCLPDGSLRIHWVNDLPPSADGPHTSVYSPAFVRRYATLRSRVRARFNDQRQILWDGARMRRDVLAADYADYMTNDDALFAALRHLSAFGLVLVRGIPADARTAVEAIAQRIGPLKNTFHGPTWDVRSEPEPANIACTPLELGHQMDLLYFESPPGIQLLHCIENAATGGESLFADAVRAATLLRLNSPPLFRSLTSFPVTFHYHNAGHHYHCTHPTVALDPHGFRDRQRIAHVNWAPPFQAPFEADTGGDSLSLFRQYIVAAKELGRHLDDPAAQFQLRLEPGVCALFLNRRVVHSRRAFDPASGPRWLRGAYLDIDAFRSRLRVLSELHRSASTNGPGADDDDADDAYAYIR